MKEAHVSSLVTLAGADSGETLVFEDVLKSQIEDLRKQISKEGFSFSSGRRESSTQPGGNLTSREEIRRLPGSFSDTAPWTDQKSGRVFQSGLGPTHGKWDLKSILDEFGGPRGPDSEAALATFLDQEQKSGARSSHDGNIGGKDVRVLLDGLSEQQQQRNFILEGALPRLFDVVPPSHSRQQGGPGRDPAGGVPRENTPRVRHLLDRMERLKLAHSGTPETRQYRTMNSFE